MRTIAEAWTQLITGYILFNKHPICYKSWISRRYPFCGTLYGESIIKPIALLAFLTNSFKELIELYFHPCEEEWLVKYQNLLTKCGIGNFLFIKGKWDKALNKLVSSLKRKFKNSFSSHYGRPIGELLDDLYRSM